MTFYLIGKPITFITKFPVFDLTEFMPDQKHQKLQDEYNYFCKTRVAEGIYTIVVGFFMKPLSPTKNGEALCYQTAEKLWGTCPQAPCSAIPVKGNINIDL